MFVKTFEHNQRSSDQEVRKGKLAELLQAMSQRST
jgi:hypothetical protein